MNTKYGFTRLRWGAWTLFAIALAACSASPPTPNRTFLQPKEDLSQGYGAYGYILLVQHSDQGNIERNLAACKAYVARLQPESSYQGVPKSSLLPTAWFVDTNSEPSSCDELVKCYGYSRAAPMLSAIGKLGANGPVLVAWAQRPGSNSNTQEPLVFDLSDFGAADMDRAFGIWMDRIARNPALWQQGFNLIKIREAVRNELQAQGGEVFSIVTAGAIPNADAAPAATSDPNAQPCGN